MASRYTDVDLMMLKRWEEVKALRDSFNELIDRMQDVVEASLQRVSIAVSERGLSSEFNVKQPSIWFWKREWANRKNEPGVYFEVFDFAPLEYGNKVEAYPSTWLMTDEFSRLKFRESSEDFGRALRTALSPELLTRWSHEDVDLIDQPLGREYRAVSETDRVHLVAEPDALEKFISGRVDDFMELAPAVDQVLQAMTRK